MSNLHQDELFAHLTGEEPSTSATDWSELEATVPQHYDTEKQTGSDPHLTEMFQRINQLTAGEETAEEEPVSEPVLEPDASNNSIKLPSPYAFDAAGDYYPVAPRSFEESGVNDSQVEGLILKYLLNRGSASGHLIAKQLAMPFALLGDILQQLKQDRLVVFKNAAAMNDYVYALTDSGRERARRLSEECTYFGAAPVSLEAYIESVAAQSLQGQHPTETDLKAAFSDLLINPNMLNRLGPAINSGRGMFLFGAPGNGKTSIAERITKSFGQSIWVPRALGIDGEILRLFDPSHHEEMPMKKGEGLLDHQRIDTRWVRIRRPTIIVGGELTMEALEVTSNSTTGISESPVQLKANCGTLVIDDFGRQRMAVDELLNRWIVPLEKRYDILHLANGKIIQVPFDQLVVFSTNLEPRDLVDDAFLRRIPYKIEVTDPSEEEYRELFKIMCPLVGMEYREAPINYLIETHYKSVNRPYRCCQPRDLLQQVKSWCLYKNEPPELTNDNFDMAVQNYFAVM